MWPLDEPFKLMKIKSGSLCLRMVPELPNTKSDLMKSVEMYGTELRTTIEDLNAEPEFLLPAVRRATPRPNARRRGIVAKEWVLRLPPKFRSERFRAIASTLTLIRGISALYR